MDNELPPPVFFVCFFLAPKPENANLFGAIGDFRVEVAIF
jgi:hypothetical protein